MTDPLAAPGSLARPRILYLGADRDAAGEIERSLATAYDLVRVADAEDALSLLVREPFVAVVAHLDAGGNGAEFLEAAQNRAPRTRRVLVANGDSSDTLVAAIHRAQPHRVLKVPLEHSEIRALLDPLVSAKLLEDDQARWLDEIQRLNAELAALSYRDPLTGLYGKHTILDRLREEVSRGRRYQRPLSIIVGNLDHFQELNERLGYEQGDEVLRVVAEVLLSSEVGRVRASDIAARGDGDSFVLILPETHRAGARIKAERIISELRAKLSHDEVRTTTSLGVATFPDDAHTADRLLEAAVAALANAKESGRDQVVVASGLTGDEAAEPELATLADSRTLSTYHEQMYLIVSTLSRERALGCLYVDLTRLRKVEQEYGTLRHNDLLDKVGQLLLELRGVRMRSSDMLCRADDGDAFVYFLAPSRRTGDSPAEELEKLAHRVQESIDAALAREVFDLIHDHPRIAIGYGRVLQNPMIRSERLVTRLVDEARESSTLMRRRQAQRDKDLLQEIILAEGLTAVYQPIVDLQTGSIFGFEGLTRGPKKTPLEAPLALFSVAEEVNLLFELDRACFRNGLKAAANLQPVHRLFLNLLPLSFYDSAFIETEITQILVANNLTPANIVFEITERLAIENFTSFKRALAVYTGMGFGVAVDDVGTKHSNLEVVMALRPHFVKLSDVLTRGVAKSTVKREMLRSLGRISTAIDAVMVAEGIETADDMAVLTDLGIKYGQGYFLARPAPPFAEITEAARTAMAALADGSLKPVVLDGDDGDDEHDEGDARVRTSSSSSASALWSSNAEPLPAFENEPTGMRRVVAPAPTVEREAGSTVGEAQSGKQP